MQNSLDSVSIHIDKTEIVRLNTQLQKLVKVSGVSLLTLAKEYPELLSLIQTVNDINTKLIFPEED